MQIEFITEECAKYTEFWKNLPREGLVPSRSDFFPEEIPSLLQNFIMHDFISVEESIIRLAGTSFSNRYSEDITGRNYLDFVEDDRKIYAGTALLQMAEQPCGMRVLLRQITKSGRAHLSESVGFPLLNKVTGRYLLLFQHVVIEDSPHLFEPAEQLANFDVNKRDFIDIGAGIPK